MSSRKQIGVCAGGDARNSSTEAYGAGLNPPARSRRPSAFRSPASSSIRTTRVEDVVAISSTTTIGRARGVAHRPLVQSVASDWLNVQLRAKPHEIDHRSRTKLFHDVVAMGLDRPFGGAQVEGDLFVQLPAEQMGEHLTLAWCELVVAALSRLQSLPAGTAVRVALQGAR